MTALGTGATQLGWTVHVSLLRSQDEVSNLVDSVDNLLVHVLPLVKARKTRLGIQAFLSDLHIVYQNMNSAIF